MKERIYKFFIFLILVFLISLFVKGYLYRKEINENRRQTVAQFVYCKKFPKSSSSYFEYYVNGKLYKEEYGKCPEDCENKLGKYYNLNYSSLDPQKITVDFSEEIKDIKKITNAGFTVKK